MSATTPAPSAFGFGAQVFGEAPEPAGLELKASDDVEEEESSDEDDDDEDDELVTAMASTTLDQSKWKEAPAYRSLYLSTTAEYLPAAPKPKIPPGTQVVDIDDDKGGKDNTWGMEGYENSLEVDHAFERFTNRVGYEGEQCLR